MADKVCVQLVGERLALLHLSILSHPFAISPCIPPPLPPPRGRSAPAGRQQQSCCAFLGGRLRRHRRTRRRRWSKSWRGPAAAAALPTRPRPARNVTCHTTQRRAATARARASAPRTASAFEWSCGAARPLRPFVHRGCRSPGPGRLEGAGATSARTSRDTTHMLKGRVCRGPN